MTTAVIDETQAQAAVEPTEAPTPQPKAPKTPKTPKTPKATQSDAPSPTPAQTPDAPVPGSDGRYASDEVQERLAAGVKAAREAGFSRTKLQELTELTPAQLWRIEGGRAHKHEVEQVEAVLGKIASGEVTPPVKPGKANEAQRRVEAVRTQLFEAQANPKLTKAELVLVIVEAYEALGA